MGDAKLQLEVVTPARRALALAVDEVRAPGVEGGFGVRPGHTPFLAALRAGELTYVADGVEHHLAVGAGFAQVANDRVVVLTEIAERPEEIDVAGAKTDQESMSKELLAGDNAEGYERRRALLERAAARLSVAQRAR